MVVEDCASYISGTVPRFIAEAKGLCGGRQSIPNGQSNVNTCNYETQLGYNSSLSSEELKYYDSIALSGRSLDRAQHISATTSFLRVSPCAISHPSQGELFCPRSLVSYKNGLPKITHYDVNGGRANTISTHATLRAEQTPAEIVMQQRTRGAFASGHSAETLCAVEALPQRMLTLLRCHAHALVLVGIFVREHQERSGLATCCAQTESLIRESTIERTSMLRLTHSLVIEETLGRAAVDSGTCDSIRGGKSRGDLEWGTWDVACGLACYDGCTGGLYSMSRSIWTLIDHILMSILDYIAKFKFGRQEPVHGSDDSDSDNAVDNMGFDIFYDYIEMLVRYKSLMNCQVMGLVVAIYIFVCIRVACVDLDWDTKWGLLTLFMGDQIEVMDVEVETEGRARGLAL
ncbi:hypothetical protein Tco_0951499 [Tanacetum coccineum]|uniref:Uncharacterized protein n=1 Tax=Tanacetum coccineum TaxID=301880 RepID=A0ABQ5DV79_9ASTR